MRERKVLPESRREEVAGDPLLDPVAEFASSDTFTVEGDCEMNLKTWVIHVGSPALLASPPIKAAVDDSKPCEMASEDSPRRDAIAPILTESNASKSELTLALVITSTSFVSTRLPPKSNFG
jgi:hypothetical protein